MFFIRCPFCHQLVFRLFFAAHQAKHTKLRPDGQMTDHISVHPTGRFQGALKGVPKAYRHPLCGVATGMPEEFIRSYLVNPFLYSGGSFCCGCNGYVPFEDLYWVETNEDLASYLRKLQEEYVRVHGGPPPQQDI